MRDAAGARRRRFLTIMKMRALLTLIMATATAYGGTVTGTLQGASGLPVKNGTLTFTLQQAGLIVGTGSVVPTTAYCYTSTDGSVVGTPNPLTLPSTSINYGSGTLPAGIYYVVFSFYDSGANRTLVSPELQVQLTGGGSLNISPPLTWPSSAVGMTVYIGPRAELRQPRAIRLVPRRYLRKARQWLPGLRLWSPTFLPAASPSTTQSSPTRVTTCR